VGSNRPKGILVLRIHLSITTLQRFVVLAASWVLLAATTVTAFAGNPPLPARYKEWLTRDVAYIITNEEKKAFLQLPNDEARDKFIEQFWELRNPTPGAPNNPYKDEIYQRIAYANQWYGDPGRGNGWRTPRGQVYITLGKPEQVAKYLGLTNVRPMEIWFYQNENPALPPYFYVIFYQREVGGEWRLYSPYMDGPEALTQGSSTENDRVSSWRVIDHQAGREVARTVLSLLPDEPVDYQTATSSLSSDVMLGTIRSLANNPMNKDLLQERRRLLEAVSHRVIMPGEYLQVVTVPLLNNQGDTEVHYLLRLQHPDDFTVVQDKEKDRYYYAATVTVRVLTPEDKTIFSQERKLSQYLSEAQLLQRRNKVFGYEGVLPLPPGKYKIEFLLGDETKHTAFRQEQSVVVPSPPTHGLLLTDAALFTDATATTDPAAPFVAANVRFNPLAAQNATIVAGHDLKFFYQVWAPPAEAKGQGSDEALDVEYAYGRMGMRDTKTISEKLPRNQFAANGTLINGKKITTFDMPAGRYRLAVTVSDPVTHERAFTSFNFTIAGSAETPSSWDVSDPDAQQELRQGTRDYQRGLCYLSEGNVDQAIVSFRRAWQKSSDEFIRQRLISLLYAKNAFAEIADLYAKGGISKDTDDETILLIAESLEKVGQVGKSIQLLESAVPLKHSSALYLTLAVYYQKIGNAQKAAEMEQKGKEIASATPKS
jgi:GWxTD domain-containing protein